MQEIEKRKMELLVRLDERTKGMADKLNRIDKIIYGNGKGGLCERMDNCETQIRDTTEDHDKSINTIKWTFGAMSTIIIIIVTLVNYFKI